MKFALILGLALLAVAHAKCPNSCSGHGTCSKGDICTCYNEKTEMYALEGASTFGGSSSATSVNANEMAAWTGADCSLRTCPRGMSWNVPAGNHDCITKVCDGAFYGGLGSIHVYTLASAGLIHSDMVFTQVVASCTNAGNTCTDPTGSPDVQATDGAAYSSTTYGQDTTLRIIVNSQGTNGWSDASASPTLQVKAIAVSAEVATNPVVAGMICTQAGTSARAVMAACTVGAGKTCAGYQLGSTTFANSNAAITCGASSDYGPSAASIPVIGSITAVATSDGTYATQSVVYATDGYASGNTNSAQTNLALKNTGKTDHNDNVECSDAGLCDRSSGVCQCFDGYEGSACQRTECPNDCSGQGTCMPNTLFATDAGVRYSGAWDSGKHYGCKCDAGFRGADCSLKECPSFADPMYATTHNDNGNTVGRDCSGRGLCDYATGLCQCFSGYTGADCSDVLALE